MNAPVQTPAYFRPLEMALGGYLQICFNREEQLLQEQAWERVMQIVQELRASGIRGLDLHRLLQTSGETTMKEHADLHPYAVNAYRNGDLFIFRHLAQEHIAKILIEIEMQGDGELPDVRPLKENDVS